MGSIQRGGIIRKNDNGTLERIDGTNTYIGSATLESGRVITKRFRCQGFDEEAVAERWLKWQGRKTEDIEEKEEIMAEEITQKQGKSQSCPFSGGECTPGCAMFSPSNLKCSLMLGGIGLYNIAANLSKLNCNDAIELVAMAIADEKGKEQAESAPLQAETKTVADGIRAYLGDKTFLSFVNLHSKTVYSPYKKFCEEEGYPADSEANFSKELLRSFPELKSKTAHGGRTFIAA